MKMNKLLSLAALLIPFSFASGVRAQNSCGEDPKKQASWASGWEKMFVDAQPQFMLIGDIASDTAVLEEIRIGGKPSLNTADLQLPEQAEKNWQGYLFYNPCSEKPEEELIVQLMAEDGPSGLKAKVITGKKEDLNALAYLNKERDTVVILSPNPTPRVASLLYLLRQKNRNTLVVKVEALDINGSESLLGYGLLTRSAKTRISKSCVLKAFAQYMSSDQGSFPAKELGNCSN